MQLRSLGVAHAGRVVVVAVFCLFVPVNRTSAAEAFEVGPDHADQLPKGKEADGIIGDFVLRNDKVEAVISGNLPLRRANMSTFYGATGITPGCLYDLALRGGNNDQITVFTPANQQGAVSYVRIVKDGREGGGEAAVETVVTAANNTAVYRRHEYRIRDGWQGVLITTTLRNEGKEPAKLRAADRWTVFNRTGTAFGDVTWADAIDPADKAGYAYAAIEAEGKPAKAPPEDVDLPPGRELTFARFLAVGRSPAEAVGVVAAFRGQTGNVSGSLKNRDASPVRSATVGVMLDGELLPAYPDDNGAFSFQLPPGSYNVEIRDTGRETVKKEWLVAPEGRISTALVLPDASAVEFDVRDEDGRPIPCKAQFIGINGTKSPNLGPQNRAHGCVDQYHSEKGSFRVQVPPGEYRVVVTHGIEFTHLNQDVHVSPGQTAAVRGTLRRVVQTPGWVSADYHNHSTQSGDNTCGTDDRIINLAAEQLEFAPTTEHNRLYDWRPHIERLGLKEEINTVPGLELTGSGTHLNSFPFNPVPDVQDRGAPVWNKDPRISAITLRDHQKPEPDRWIQFNHPDMVENFIDRDGDGRADGGYLHVGGLIDGLETQNGNAANILATMPYRVGRDPQTRQERVEYNREFIWLQLLNRGHKVWGVAVSDAHSVYGNGVGGWRTYIPSRGDRPADVDWREMSRNSKAGRMILTNGPYLEVTTADGATAGGFVRASRFVELKVRVQCTDWLDVDRVQVLVNGRQRKDLNFTRKSHADLFRGRDSAVRFEGTIEVPLSEDAHLIVVAYGENSGDLSVGYGTSPQAKMKPCAYNNPIFVDVDGGGFTPNGDTLGFALPVKGMSVRDVRALGAQ